MIGNIRKPAFTLLEVIVSVAIFSVIVLISTQIFQSVVSSQVKSFSETALQDEAKYFLEVFTQEVRGALKNTTGAGLCSDNLPAGYTYSTDGDVLYFSNKLGECVSYYRETDSDGISRLVLNRDGAPFYISSDKINIQSLKFVVADSATVQPLVTANFTIVSKTSPELSALNIQTSISSGWSSN
ncbi:MAG: prepilin-type N-terminal cleavage/methylation domain-containing protein [Patescibacteria group bacterium]